MRQYNEKYHWAVLPIYGYDTDNNPYPLSWNGGAAGYSEVQDYRASEDYFSTNIFSDYSKTIGDHYFKVMAGFNAELYKKGGLTGFGTDLITPSVPELNTTQDNKNAYNSASELAIAGFFGRINYDYKGKYLAEVNIRYDGTSRSPRTTLELVSFILSRLEHCPRKLLGIIERICRDLEITRFLWRIR
mgnify:CR=1 FL=1